MRHSTTRREYEARLERLRDSLRLILDNLPGKIPDKYRSLREARKYGRETLDLERPYHLE